MLEDLRSRANYIMEDQRLTEVWDPCTMERQRAFLLRFSAARVKGAMA